MIFPNIPMTFVSRRSVRSAALRLSAVVETNPFLMLIKPAIYGSVSEERVRLPYSFPLLGNSSKPYYYGRFIERAEGAELVGQFTVCSLSKILIRIWFGLVVLVTILTSTILFSELIRRGISGVIDDDAWLGPTVCTAFLVFGLFLVRGGWWLSRGDIARISTVIDEALGTTSQEMTPPE